MIKERWEQFTLYISFEESESTRFDGVRPNSKGTMGELQCVCSIVPLIFLQDPKTLLTATIEYKTFKYLQHFLLAQTLLCSASANEKRR